MHKIYKKCCGIHKSVAASILSYPSVDMYLFIYCPIPAPIYIGMYQQLYSRSLYAYTFSFLKATKYYQFLLFKCFYVDASVLSS